MKKLNFFAFFFIVVCSNAQTLPCNPWPWCEQELQPVIVPGPLRPPGGPLPPFIKPPSPPPRVPIPQPNNNIPCAGTPMKDMEIAGSAEGKNIRGGTYGYTRRDKYGNQKFHDGIDIAGDVGANIHNMHAGTVTRIENSFAPGQYGRGKDGYGNYVQIESVVNGETFTLKYNHLNSVADIKVGNQISQAQVIGTLGKTGNASAPNQNIIPHVHVQAMDKNGKSINPEKHLNAEVNQRTGEIKPNCK